MEVLEGLDGMDGETCVRQAYQSIFQGDFEAALRWFQQAIERDPDNASYHYKASITCARSGKAELAEFHARRAVELDPEDPDYALNLQTVEARSRVALAKEILESATPDVGKAKELLSEAEQLDPLSAEAKLLLAIACRMLGDFRSAVSCLRDVLTLEPQHDEAGRLLREWRAQRRRSAQSQLHPSKPKRNR